jgi:chorismate mutase
LDVLQNNLENVLRSLNERAYLCRDIARVHASGGRLALERVRVRAAEEAETREEAIRQMAESNWVHPKNEPVMPS